MKVLIIEDEINCAEVLETMLRSINKDLTKFERSNTVESGLEKINSFEPAIVFLDIQLGGQNCFELLDQLDAINFQLVFTTAYDHYAIKAFNYAAVHYLLKPILKSDLVEALNRCLQNQIKNTTDSIEVAKSIYLRTTLMDYNLAHDDIFYIEADGSYSTLYSLDRSPIFVSKKLADFDRILPEFFFRIHHSFMVNLKWVKHLDKKENLVILKNGMQLPISRRKKTELKRLRSNLGF